jgi:4-hydroxy-3-methylbut-2-enyl diphosphate reductase IspH
MIVTVESKAKPCPGVEQAVARTEDVLRRGDVLYSVGELIHNRREVERL